MRGIRRRRRHSHKVLAAALTVLILAGLGGALLGYLFVKPSVDRLQTELMSYLQAGQRELEAGKATLTDASTEHDATLVPQAIVHFIAARRQFFDASQVADHSNLLRYLESVPVAGAFAYARHTAVVRIAAMGVALSDAGLDSADLYGQLIKPPATPADRNLLTVLDSTKAGRADLLANFRRAGQAAAQVDTKVIPDALLRPFLKARQSINAAVSGLEELERLVPVLAELLGANGTRTYLLEQVNPAELRAGGGFIGTYSLLKAEHGTLKLITSRSASDLAEPRPQPGEPTFIPQPGPYREVIPNVSWSFLDSNLFPDFVSNARAALSFVQPRLGTNIDGVISIDYYTVRGMLELTGPLKLPDYKLTVEANNFIREIVWRDIARDPTHKAILSAIAAPLMERVTALTADRWPALIASLGALAAGRHLQAYFTNDLVETEIDRIGWSGSVNPTGAKDYMMEVESNYYGDKANYFVTRHYTVVLTRTDGVLHHQVSVNLVNDEPCGSEERTTYKVNVRLYIGESSRSVFDNLRAVQYTNPDPPSGVRLLDGWLPDIRCGGNRGAAKFVFDTPWSLQDMGAYSIYWQKQPGVDADKLDIIWNASDGNILKASGDLSVDRIITLAPTSIALNRAESARSSLPSLALG